MPKFQIHITKIIRSVKMLNKTCIFSLLAFGLILAPNVASADQETIQEINQSGTAIGRDSRVNQRANQRSTQRQSRKGRRCSYDSQRQRSRQRIDQNAVAEDGSRVDQNADQRNDQRQRIRRGRFDCD